MSEKKMNKLKEGDELTFDTENIINQEYLENKGLVAIYTYSCDYKKKDGTSGTLRGYSAEPVDVIEDETGTYEYKIDSVTIKKIHDFSFTNPNMDPVGGAIAGCAYYNYYQEHKEEVDNQRIWYKIVILPFNVEQPDQEGFAFIPVLSDTKKEDLEKIK